jgi:hypothetical protein
MPILLISCYRLHLVIYCEHVKSNDFMCHLLVACTILLYNHVHKRVENHVQCASWKVSKSVEELVLSALQFSEVGICLKFPRWRKHESLLIKSVLYGELVIQKALALIISVQFPSNPHKDYTEIYSFTCMKFG